MTLAFMRCWGVPFELRAETMATCMLGVAVNVQLATHLNDYVVIIIIIIIKTSSTGPSGENKVVYKLLSLPHKHLRHEN